ncbi:kinase-like domain-containing protein [Phaeosphaeriaceae sp. PMI808]|nr:kinase-like domain-containing protein [Phaeosphaeriaceae sp. PMI808]
MSSAASEDLYCELDDALKQGALGGQKFLPLDVLEEKITEKRLKAAIPSSFSFRKSSLPKDVAQYARKIFAILLFIGEPEAIKVLWKQGLRDEHLPLTAGSTRDKLTTEDGRVFGAWNTAAKASEFLEKQWLVQAPVFDTRGNHHQLNNKCSMPFVEADEVGGGAFSYVHKCEVHQAHQKGLKVEDGKIYVAVKRFKIRGDPRAFEQEKDNLKKLENLNHLHMIRHHATCELDNLYYVIFPWADGGNLAEYWKLEDQKPRSSGLAFWMLQQLLGLAGALDALHGKGCRHGDLKPDNILHFNSKIKPILVIGDVGVSRFHKQDTFLRDAQTTTNATTPSYQAPEVYGDPMSPRSRKYDMWSLGCIFLEFVVWFLWDNNAILAFQETRAASDKYSYFYKQNTDGSIDVHPMVTDAISTILKDPRMQTDTVLHHLLVSIRDDLLQVNVEQRSKADDFVAKMKSLTQRAKERELSIYASSKVSIPRPTLFQLRGKRPLNRTI